MRMYMMRLVVVTMLAVGVAACGNTKPSGDVAAGRAEAGAIKVVAKDGAFAPRTLELPPGTQATVEFTNRDDQRHNFAIETLGLNTGLIKPGKVVTARFTAPKEPVEFVCTIHSGMKGTIAIDRV